MPTFFYQCELGPDGKIYVSVSGGQFAVHVIEHPDSAGMACQVIQHKYILDYPIIGGLPHFPNFQLGALPGGACPSVSVAEVGEEAEGAKIYPNPASTMLYVVSSGSDSQYKVYDMLGKLVRQGYLAERETELDISLFSNGLYFISMEGLASL